jgi:predicted aspartyl protease
MAITFVEGRLRGPGGREAGLRFLVDSGAVYSLVPEPVWRELAIERLRTETFSFAGGTLVERDVGECMLDLGPLGRATTPVILGQADDEALLGAVTLEILGLVLNPFNRTLQPMRLPLKGVAAERAGR